MALVHARRLIARKLGALALVAMLAGATGAAAGQYADSTIGTPELAGPALLRALRAGGHILYFRHTSTDFGQSDGAMTGYEDCTRQRNLTDQGRAEARAIGGAMRKLGIPVGDVLTSPFCRTTETAQLMFGRATQSPAVRGGPPSAEGGRYAELQRLLATRVTGGVNLVIASHGNPFRAVADGPYLAEGEAAVIEPRGGEGFRVVARIRKDDWDRLATDAK